MGLAPEEMHLVFEHSEMGCCGFNLSGGCVKPFRASCTFLLLILLVCSFAHAQFPPAPGTGPGLPETVEAIDAARVTTRILYITAHPDDESAAVLTYLARGLHADVALLSVSRGEGGHNALGPEQAPQLGLIRTQELLAATRGYGVKLYFTRAKDFGFSKTPEETEKIWGDAVLEDMVRVIRDFRPNIVIDHFGGVHSGHGHHQTAGLWTPKAVQLAADETAFSELLKEDLSPWKPEGKMPIILDVYRGDDKANGLLLPLDDVSPLYGKSWREIGIDAFTNHRTQGIAGFLNSPFIKRPITLVPEGDQKFGASQLAEPLTKLLGSENGKTCAAHHDWCDALKKSDEELSRARLAVLALDYSTATNLLLDVQKHFASMRPADSTSCGDLGDHCLPVLDQFVRVSKAFGLAAGFVFEAEAERSELVLGEPLPLTVFYHCRPGVPCPFEGPVRVWAGDKLFTPTGGDPVHGLKFDVTLDTVPAPPSMATVLLLCAGPQPLIRVSIKERIDPTHEFLVNADVFYTYASSTSVTRVPVRLVPAYTLTVEPKQTVEVLAKLHNPFDVFLRIHSYSVKPAELTAGLETPDGLHASPPVQIKFGGIGDQYVKLTVTPPEKLESGNYSVTAYANRNDETFYTSIEPLPSMPTLFWSEPAKVLVHAFDINVPENLRVGYISAEGEPIPDALKRLGISVDLLDPVTLNFGDLSRYSAIVVGVRAYELRPELAGANKRLLEYVSNGGTLVVQYNRDGIWDRLQPAPYPAKIGSPTPRITDENSLVKILRPDDPLLNHPNKITLADFQGWIQERGLYFWSDFDSRYTPLLAMNDPGEKDLNGALVYAKYGKGTYIYTGLAFFRQLPEGVPGAYRLFVNLLAASQSK
jgi:LmbE family N-acetylglucosaminyl deacetylase